MGAPWYPGAVVPTRVAAACLALLAACAADAGRAPPAPPPAQPPPSLPAVVASACATSGATVADASAPAEDPPASTAPAPPPGPCDVVPSNLARVEGAILATHVAAAPVAVAPWDHRGKPARLDAVARRFALSPAEIAALHRDGFVVPAKLEFPTYALAFHEIYQSEMPLYVSADAAFHAVFKSDDALAGRLERDAIAPRLDRLLAAMHCALPGARESDGADAARDLDVYLTVARSLLAGHAVPAVLEGDDATAARLVEKAIAAQGIADEELFGRQRQIDWSAYTPRGRYAADGGQLTPYFRAVMWLSRIEYNLVSRSCRSSQPLPSADPSETPREALDALALADLADRAGVRDDVRAIDLAFAALAGKREDVSIDDLAALQQKAQIASITQAGAFDRLKAAVGERFQRTTRVHPMPEGTTTLPAIATLLGPRIVADATATMSLVAPLTRGRSVIGAADMAYALGQDRARAYLKDEIKQYPDLDARLDEARAALHAPPAAAAPGTTGTDLYGAWLRAILALGEKPEGVVPSFMRSAAFADLRMSSTVAAFAQLKHNAVLLAGQGYDLGGCQIPDGFVEPVPDVYEALARHADRGAVAAVAVDPRDRAGAAAYFDRAARVLRVLAAIARDELAGRPLGADELAFLSMIMELDFGSTGRSPRHDGWYFDLFPATEIALAQADLIADYFTSQQRMTVSYAGAKAPRLGVFVVDTGGPPRVVAGPVARGFELHRPLDHRLDDASAQAVTQVDDPWAASYTVPAPEAPHVMVVYPASDTDAAEAWGDGGRVGRVTVELLDHHRRVIESLTRDVAGKNKTRFPFKQARDERQVEAIHVAVGAAHGWAAMDWKGAFVEMGAGADAPH